MLVKTLQDSDSLYCNSDDCTSKQTAFFLGQTTDPQDLEDMNHLFGENFEDNCSVEIVLSKRNIILNLICHFLRQTVCYQRKDDHADPAAPWTLDYNWLNQTIKAVEDCISGISAKFSCQIHRETTGLFRVYLKGIKHLSLGHGSHNLDLQLVIFSGDAIHLKKVSGAVSLEITNQDAAMQTRVEKWLAETERQIASIPTQETIDIEGFVKAFVATRALSKLTYCDALMARFVSAVLAKNFIVLTGLSGSGKTKLAQLFAEWISCPLQGSDLLLPNESFKEGAYYLNHEDELDYKIRVVESGKLRTVSKNAVRLWIQYLKAHPEVMGTDPKEIRKDIQRIDTLDDNYMHGSDAILYHIASNVLARRDPFLSVNDVAMYLIVPVGADWTNSEHLLGYPDALQPGKYVMPDTGVLKLMLAARDNPNLPFFLILDEMNLSHVERYFADFLSAMESGDEIKLYDGEQRKADGIDIPKTLKFPKNLFVIGTMNVDETTYMFSPKVLDRAQVIEFRVSEGDMAGFLANPTVPDLDAIKGKGAKYAEAFLKLKDNQPPLDVSGSTNKDAIAEALNKFFPELAKLGAEFGYRTAGEVVRFCSYYLAAGATIDDAIDAAFVQKLLPKLHGSQVRLGPVLKTLKDLASKKVKKMEAGEEKEVSEPCYKLTCEKLTRMQERLKANGFTSFAEA